MTIKERIQTSIDTMWKRRAAVLDEYLLSLSKPSWDQPTASTALEASDRLHECDIHIATLQVELKTVNSNPGKAVGNAS